MKSFYKKSLLIALGLIGFTGTVEAAEFGSPSLLPVPSVSKPYSVSPVGYRNINDASTPSPSDQVPVPVAESPAIISGDYQDALNGTPSCEGSYIGDAGAGCCEPVCTKWFGGVNALIMTRNHHSGLITAYDSTTGNTIMGSCSTNMTYTGGIDTTVGRMFGCCGNTGIMVNYWGLYPQNYTAQAWGGDFANGVSTPISFNGLQYNDGTGNQAYSNFYNNATLQRIEQQLTINSVEVNLIGNSLYGSNVWGGNNACCGTGGCNGSRLGMGWGAGIRYFQFNDSFKMYSDPTDVVFNGAANEVCYHTTTKNNLLGFQLAGGLNYCVTNRLSIYGMSRAGIYGNNVSQSQYAAGTLGDATVAAGPFAGHAYRVSGGTMDLAFIGQLDLGTRWQVSNRWSINAGYRIVGLSGLALATQQVPQDFSNIGIASHVNNNGSTILNGAYIGATLNF